MNKQSILILIVSVILLTVVTVFCSSQNVGTHKQVVFSNNSYEFVQQTTPVYEQKVTSTPVNIEHKEIQNSVQSPINVVQNSRTLTTNTSNTKPIVKVQDNVKKQTVKVTPKQTKQSNVKTNVVPQNMEKSTNVTTQTSTNNTSVEKKETQKVSTPQTNTSVVKTTSNPVSVQTIKTQSVQEKPAKKVLTEKEEVIAWNKWRSDLQNKVMRDTNIYAPKGTKFCFSFTVDKFGNMSNIKVWSENDVYTNLAVKVIKPVLTSYQKTAILKFPEGTKRTITNVDGYFVMSNVTKYSTPEQYSDYERVKTKQ